MYAHLSHLDGASLQNIIVVVTDTSGPTNKTPCILFSSKEQI